MFNLWVNYITTKLNKDLSVRIKEHLDMRAVMLLGSFSNDLGYFVSENLNLLLLCIIMLFALIVILILDFRNIIDNSSQN
jgi:hypothetical protein